MFKSTPEVNVDQPLNDPRRAAEPPPIACSLSERELIARGREIEELARAALIEGSRLEGRVRLVYRRSEAVEATVRDLMEREARCCPFLGFELVAEQDVLTVDISGPPEATSVLDAIHRSSTAR